MRQIGPEELKYYRTEVDSMKALMDRFDFTLHDFEQPNQHYTVKHKELDTVIGKGKIPAEAVGNWIDEIAWMWREAQK